MRWAAMRWRSCTPENGKRRSTATIKKARNPHDHHSEREESRTRRQPTGAVRLGSAKIKPMELQRMAASKMRPIRLLNNARAPLAIGNEPARYFAEMPMAK